MTQFPAVQRIDLTSFSLGVLAELIGRGVGPATVALEASGVVGLFVPGEVLAVSKSVAHRGNNAPGILSVRLR